MSGAALTFSLLAIMSCVAALSLPHGEIFSALGGFASIACAVSAGLTQADWNRHHG
jgi:hypothetical protein